MKLSDKVVYEGSLLTDHDIYLFKQGSHFTLFEKMGAHMIELNGIKGTHFAVWAPNAEKVSVIGDFNDWNKASHPLKVRDDGSGIWEGFIAGLGAGVVYKYHIVSKHNGYRVDKGDPFAFLSQTPPATASVICDLEHGWDDGEWMQSRLNANALGRRLRFMKCISGPGEGSPKKTIARSRTGRWRTISPSIFAKWVSLMWNFSPLWSIPFSVHGVIRPWDISHPQPDMGRLRTSCS